MEQADQRTISMPLSVYEQDIDLAKRQGHRAAARRFAKIIKAMQDDPRGAVRLIVEDFEGSQISIDEMVDACGLRKVAEEIWGSKCT
jgi:hypothetical protein